MNDDHQTPLVGVLSLQGAFREHRRALERTGARTREVRRRRQLEGLDALVIPGGESTTIGKLMVEYDLLEAVRGLGREGMPILGTCAGLVLLAGAVVGGEQPLVGLMDIEARRNAFGRQVHSFEAELELPLLDGKPFPGVFIRAPWIESAGPGVEVLATHAGHAVAAREGNLLVTAFHPELTADVRLHGLFLEMVAGRHPAGTA